MIPFSGFMQTTSGSVPGGGNKTENIRQTIHGLQNNNDTVFHSDDNAHSFLAWVQAYADNGTTAETEGQDVFNLQANDHEFDLPSLDQLQELIAGATDQAHTENHGCGHIPFPQGIMNALIAYHESRHLAGSPIHEAGPGVPEIIALKDSRRLTAPTPPGVTAHPIQTTVSGTPEHTGPAGSRQTNEGAPDLGKPATLPVVGPTSPGATVHPIQTTVSDIPEHTGPAGSRQTNEGAPDLGKPATPPGARAHPIQTTVSDIPEHTGPAGSRQTNEGAPDLGKPATPPGARAHPIQTTVSDIPEHTGPAGSRQTNENPPILKMTANTPSTGADKELTPPFPEPAAPAGDGGETGIRRFTRDRVSSGPGIPEKAIDPAAAQPQTIAGQARDPDSVLKVMADQNGAFSEEGAAHFQEKHKSNRSQRITLAEVKEEDVHKDQPSASAKGALPEPIKSIPSFQEATRAMAADLSKNMAATQNAGQAATLNRADASAAKTFQVTVMDQLVDKATMRSLQGRSEILIHLKPEFLGKVQMNIAADKEQLVVRILTDRPVVKEIIETHLHHLKTDLQNQGLTIDKFEVMVNPDAEHQHSREQFAQMFKNHSFSNGRRQPHGQDPESSNPDDGNASEDNQPNRDGVNYFA